MDTTDITLGTSAMGMGTVTDMVGAAIIALGVILTTVTGMVVIMVTDTTEIDIITDMAAIEIMPITEVDEVIITQVA
ncbi:hypothetical protein FB2170_01716 [Maribacter sp. HTCC2170]|nr:hypothetical protein FB2170_01716 [Maribacter sp. HTCC2170]